MKHYKLPWPPSVNHYYGNRVAGKRVIRYITAKGVEFRKEVIHIIGEVESFAKEDRLGVHVIVLQPDRRRRDIDNLGKALLDSLEHAGVYADDSQIDFLSFERDKTIVYPGGQLEVKVWKI